MKIIFLDIDGVLNSDRSIIGGNYRMKLDADKYDDYRIKFTKSTIDPIGCELINTILREFPEVSLVLSSTHRMHYHGPNKLKDLQDYLTFLGIDGSRLIGYTDVLHKPRGEEIQKWLDEHPEVEAYAIIDDSNDMLIQQAGNFVRTDPAIGISAENYKSITRLFGKEDSRLILL